MAIAAAGLLTFVGIYVGLQVAMRPPEIVPVAPPTLTTDRAVDSITPRIGAGLVAVALPFGTEPVLREVLPGARVNVLASVTEPGRTRVLSTVIARGATVVQAASMTTPVLVEVEPADAVVLAHLMLGGAPLSVAVWPGDTAPPEELPLDSRSARALLGLPARPTATPVPTATLVPTPIPPTSTPVPRATPAPPPSGPLADRYVVQPGESLTSIASQLGVDLARLKAANPNLPDTEPLKTGMQLVVPQ
jgi:LysM repeat protein